MNVTCTSNATMLAMAGEPEEGLEWRRCGEEAALACLLELVALLLGAALRAGN